MITQIFVETIVFVPPIKDSELKRRLQDVDNVLKQVLDCPGIRFIERGGTTVMGELGRTNLWSNK